MLSPEAKRSLISWEAAGPRIISAIFKIREREDETEHCRVM